MRINMRLINYLVAKRRMQNLVNNFSKDVEDAMAETADELLIPRIHSKILKNDQIFTRKLITSLGVRRASTTNTPTIRVGAFDVEYGLNVEKGGERRKVFGTPEFQKLIEWVRFKVQSNDRVNRAIAAVVARRIEKVGNKRRSFLMTTWNRTKKKFWKTVFIKLEEKIGKF